MGSLVKQSELFSSVPNAINGDISELIELVREIRDIISSSLDSCSDSNEISSEQIITAKELVRIPYEKKHEKLGPNDPIAEDIRNMLVQNGIEYKDLKDAYSRALKSKMIPIDRVKMFPSEKQLGALVRHDFYNMHMNVRVSNVRLITLKNWIKAVFAI
ncbi:MAG: hypothetical protein PHS31_05515 [Victivallaceae bacterium]|nr:hypothetical protein [Victivallaceae bacterium]MDD4181639.1 hypothetical protein [Victivallaceae bacterium]